MKKSLFVLLVIALCFAMVSCSKSESKQTSSASAKQGQVYYLNFKPEADTTWQQVAKNYTAKTGVPVKVVTAASGNYETTLISELGKSNAPTLFNIGNAGNVATYGDYAMDLTGTDVYNELTTKDFNQVDENGKTYSIGYCYEAYGIIVNTALLEKAGYTLSDIKDFASLKKIAEDIHGRASQLGFDAFTSSGLDGSSSWRFSGHLANIPLYYTFRDAKQNMAVAPATISDKYLANFKNIWDLYISNSSTDPSQLMSATGDQAEAEFYNQKAVFYQNGSWEYTTLSQHIDPQFLAMIPIYIGVAGEDKAALSSGTENCWAVNDNASAEDKKATLDFLYYCVTDPEAQELLVGALGSMPFKKAATSSNKFLADANKYLAAGNYNVAWAFNATPNVDTWRAGVVSALATYSANRTAANWAKVVDAYVNGWATQYAATKN